MTRLWSLVRGFGRFWYGFIIGDDWTVAAAVLVMIGATYGLVHVGVPAWWLGPVIVLLIATWTVHRGLVQARHATNIGR
jgi:hypothetical protein